MRTPFQPEPGCVAGTCDRLVADGRELILPRYTEPEQQMILEKLNLTHPPQPPPRVRGTHVLLS